MAKRKRYLSEEEYTQMVNESFSDSDESDDTSLELENDSTSDSDTDILSDSEIAACLPSTSRDSTSEDSFWTRELQDLKPFDFVGMSSMNKLSPIKEIDFFTTFFDDDVIQYIVKETNSFAQNQRKDTPSTSKSVQFSDVTPELMTVFFGLIILMGIIKKPFLKMYFSTNEMLSTPFFNRVISRDVFLNILKFLHFTSDSKAKKLEKLGSLIENLRNKFKTIYTPEKNICIDESLFGWKGRLGFKQYVPSKRSRYGIKIYKLCESSSGYVWNFLIYYGKETVSGLDGLHGERVVKTLMSDLSDKGHDLYVNRFFNSPSLAEYLESVKTNVCGTVKKNRKKMPKNFTRKDLKRGEVDAMQYKNMNLIAFKEKKKDVLLLTTIHAADLAKSGKKDRKTEEDILKPTCILDYNKYMGGIDIGDAIMTHHPSFRKSVKWYKKLFFGLMDIVLMNANILYDKKYGLKTPFLEFKMKVIEQIFEKFGNYRAERNFTASSSPSPLRLSGRHFPTLNLDENGQKCRRRCIVCSQTALKTKKEQRTFYFCEICNVGLCVHPCFKEYHTLSTF